MTIDYKLAIVGSRRRNSLKDRKLVLDLVSSFKESCDGGFHGDDVQLVIVSGGCPQGADKFAEEAADINKLPKIIFPIQKYPEIKSRYEFTKRAYARNQLIADECHIMYALISTDRTGGTEDSIRRAKALGKLVVGIDMWGTSTYL